MPKPLPASQRTIGKTLEWTVATNDGRAHKFCYDAIKLYLWEAAVFGPAGDKWRDPTTRVPLTREQIAQLKASYRQLSRCSTRLQKPRVMTVALSPDDVFRLPHDMWVANLFDEQKRAVPIYAYRLSKPGFGAYAYAVAESEHDGDENTVLVPAMTLIKLGLDDGARVLVETCFELPTVRRMELRPESRDWLALVAAEGSDRLLGKLTREIEQRHRVTALGDLVEIRDDATDSRHVLHVTGLSDLSRVEAADRARALGYGERRLPKNLWNTDAGLTYGTAVDLDLLPPR